MLSVNHIYPAIRIAAFVRVINPQTRNIATRRRLECRIRVPIQADQLSVTAGSRFPGQHTTRHRTGRTGVTSFTGHGVLVRTAVVVFVCLTTFR